MNTLTDLENVICLHSHRLYAGIMSGNEPVACTSASILSHLFGPIEAMKPTLPMPPWVIEHA